MQALAEGDLSERANHRAEELAHDADIRLTPPRSAGEQSGMPARLYVAGAADLRLPAPGGAIVRKYKGRAVRYRFRIDDLRGTGAQIRSLSLEPLLGPLPALDLGHIHWVIVGGESGPGARPMQAAWVTDIQEQCTRVGVPFFFKPWGGANKKTNGRLLRDRTWDEMPPHLDDPVCS